MKSTFFLQVPKGIEKLARQEIELKLPMIMPQGSTPNIVLEEGGLSLELPFMVGLQLNFWLKIPNRILLRFAHFKCRDLPKFYNKVLKLDWSPYYAGQEVTFHCSSKKSRLFDSRKVEKSFQKALDDYLKRQEPSSKAKERVKKNKEWHFFTRFEEDYCTISIDTSGLRLGLRGYKVHSGEAPLRENLTAALYLFALTSSKVNIEQQHIPLTLFDPFVGSGSFFLEPALFFNANLERKYACEYFPYFEKKGISSFERPIDHNLNKELFFIGNDLSKEQLERAKLNIGEAKIEDTDHVLLNEDLTQKSFRLKCKELINNSPKGYHWCLTNPPYGKRIERSFTQNDLLQFLHEIGPWDCLGILLPRDQGIEQHPHFENLAHLDFDNGGEKVRFTLLKSRP